jgi:hypothetical protein
VPPPTGDRLTRPNLVRALRLVEGSLHSLYARHALEDEQRRIAAITAASDPASPVWSEVLQVNYLENAREGLLTTLHAMRHPSRRPR